MTIRRHLLPLLALVIWGTAWAADDELAYQNHEVIRQEVEEFLAVEAGTHFEGEVSIEVNELDPRLRLKACPVPLKVELSPGSDALGKTTALVECSGSGGWTLYVPAQVKIMSDVLVASRFISRGDLLGPQDAKLERMDLSLLRYGYLTDPNELDGSIARRSIRMGNVILPQSVEPAPMVRRNDKITIIARSQGLEVQAHGIALQDGVEGERIRVRNLSSKREIEAVIIAPGSVEVNF